MQNNPYYQTIRMPCVSFQASNVYAVCDLLLISVNSSPHSVITHFVRIKPAF